MSEPIMVQGPKKSSWKNRLFTGFIIGGVLLVLAAIALPDFLYYSEPAKRSEAKQNLGAIFTTQVAYFGETNTFASGADCFKLLAWAPEGDPRYSYYCGEDKIVCTKCDKECPPPLISEVNGDSFTVIASGNIDKDDDCDVWTMNDAKNLKNVEIDP